MFEFPNGVKHSTIRVLKIGVQIVEPFEWKLFAVEFMQFRLGVERIPNLKRKF